MYKANVFHNPVFSFVFRNHVYVIVCFFWEDMVYLINTGSIVLPKVPEATTDA